LNHDISEGTFWNIEKEFAEKTGNTNNNIMQTIIDSNHASCNAHILRELIGVEENPLVINGKKLKIREPLNLLRRLDNHKDDVMRFLSSVEIPFDNNASERALRMIKVKNKISSCFRNEQGLEFFLLNSVYLRYL
jgi:Transposase IS66 family